MKDKSWIIILIMGIALAISIGYSVIVNQKKSNMGESTVTTTSIIEMTATTVTIKNTLTGTGTVSLMQDNIGGKNEIKPSNVNEENNTNLGNVDVENNITEQSDQIKKYKITLSIEDKDLKKAKIGQETEITIKTDTETLNYAGKVIDIHEDTNNKSTLDIEILNFNDIIKENMLANCTVIIEKVENVIGIPAEAIQENEKKEKFVDVVQDDGITKPVNIKTGISDDHYVEVIYGLNVGDRVQIVKSTTTVVNQRKNSKGFSK